MDTNHSPLMHAIMTRLSALQEERASHVDALFEIDKQLADMARQLGVPPEQIQQPALTRLPKATDKRHTGSFPEGVMKYLLAATEPLTRPMLKRLMLTDSVYGEAIRRNENIFYNTVKRYIRTDKIIELNGYLYHPERAPLLDGEEDPTGRRLPANVTPLFGNENGG